MSFIIWIGGKTKVLPALEQHVPKKYFYRYFEPFLGSGALALHLMDEKSEFKASQWHLGDDNPNLIGAWKTVKDEPLSLLHQLGKLEKAHRADSNECYYKTRDKYNAFKISKHFDPETPYGSLIEQAARFIYLTRTNYNGLYRVNKKGEYNASLGSRKFPVIVDEFNIHKCSQLLNKHDVFFMSADYTHTFYSYPKENDFIYLDPPYWCNYTRYTAKGFSWENQVTVHAYAREWADAGAQVMISNSDNPEIRELYKDFNIHEIMSPRTINTDTKGRRAVTELVMTSY